MQALGSADPVGQMQVLSNQDAHMSSEGYEPNSPRELNASAVAASLLQQHTNLFVSVHVPDPTNQPIPVEDSPRVREGVFGFMEEQVLQSQARENTWREEYMAGLGQYTSISHEFETARSQAQDFLNREGQAANAVLLAYQQEARCSKIQLEMVQQEANMLHTQKMRGLEEEAMNSITRFESECKSSREEFSQEQDLCRRMSKEGSELLAQVQGMRSELDSHHLYKARREIQAEVREQNLETGTRKILHEMAEQVSLLSAKNLSLTSEFSEVVSGRDACRFEVSQTRQELDETRKMHRDLLHECDSLRKSLQLVVDGSSSVGLHAISPSQNFVGSQNTVSDGSQPKLHSSDGLSGQKTFSGVRVLGSSRWTDVFMQSPSVPSLAPPGLGSSGVSVNVQSHLPSHTSQLGSMSFSPQANVAGASSSRVVGTSVPGLSVVPQSLGSQGELRRDRTHLPKCDIHSDPNNPSKTLQEWETYLLKVGFAIESWLGNPTVSAEVWNRILQDATQSWQTWSVQSPSERALSERTEMMSSGAFLTPSPNIIEATLRSELCEKLPAFVIKKCMADHRVSAVQILAMAMREILPAYHTVKVSLLDSLERPPPQKLVSVQQVNASITSWLRTLKIAMGRYQVVPEPRRLWLAVQARFQPLAESNSMFAAIVGHHLMSTQIKVRQDIETVLCFSIALEAELAALVQDNPKKENPHGQAAFPKSPNPSTPSDAHKNKGKDKSGGSTDPTNLANKCPFFGTKDGCKFGQNCRNIHPFVRPGEKLCFICGSSEHLADKCSRPKRGPGDKAQKPAQNRSTSHDRRQDRSQSRRGSNSSRNNTPGRTQGNASTAQSADVPKSSATDSPKAKAKAHAKVAVVRALSAGLDSSTYHDVVLDSGASHLVLPMSWLSANRRDEASPIDLNLAAGASRSLILDGEVFTVGVRRPLVPLGKLVERTGIRLEWSPVALVLKAMDSKGSWRVFLRAHCRQCMPHIPIQALPAVRSALLETRLQAKRIEFEQWAQWLGDMLYESVEDDSSSDEVSGFSVGSMDGKGSEIHTLEVEVSGLLATVDKRHDQVMSSLQEVMSSLKDMISANQECGKDSVECFESSLAGDVELDSTSALVLDGVPSAVASPSVVHGDTPSLGLDFLDSDVEYEQDEEELFGSEPEVDVEGEDSSRERVPESTEDDTIDSPHLPDYWNMCTGEDMIPSHDLDTFLQHIENGHVPKLNTCPICQLSDGPPYIHRRLERSEIGKLSVDIAGPLSDDIANNKYLMVGVFVAVNERGLDIDESRMAPMKPRERKKIKGKKELLLPFVRLLKSREGLEVAEHIRSMIEDVEAFVSPLLPSHVPSEPRVLHVHLGLPASGSDSVDSRVDELEAVVSPLLPAETNNCVLKLHTDRAREFLSSEVFKVLQDKHIFQTVTAGHSSASNGRAESAIRVVKSLIRRMLVSSRLPVFLWSFAAGHAAQVLRALSLRKSGQRDVWQPKPFGSYVTLRKLGDAKKDFKPFEPRGVLGRLLLENLTSDRLCYVLDDNGNIHRGTSPSTTFPGPVMTEGRSAFSNAARFGWKQVSLQNGHNAWLKDDVLVLSPPLFVDLLGTEEQEDYESALDSPGVDEVSDADHCYCSCCVSSVSGTSGDDMWEDQYPTRVDAFLADECSESQALPVMPRIVECHDRVSLRKICSDIRNVVSQLTLPKMRTRTNVYGNGLDPRGILLGAFTRRGRGMTQATRRLANLTSLVHDLAKLRQDDTPYASVYVSTTSGLPVHRDSNNFLHNDVICTGTYSGGRVFVEHPDGRPYAYDGEVVTGKMFSGKHQFVRFDPTVRHAVEPSRGFRLSVVFFSPRFLSQLPESVQSALEQTGFRVREVINLQLLADPTRRVDDQSTQNEARLRSHDNPACNVCASDLSLDVKGSKDDLDGLYTSSLSSNHPLGSSLSFGSSVSIGPCSFIHHSPLGSSSTEPEPLSTSPLDSSPTEIGSDEGNKSMTGKCDDLQAKSGQMSIVSGACQHFDLASDDEENGNERVVRFSVPEIEQLVEFEVVGKMRSITMHRNSCKTRKTSADEICSGDVCAVASVAVQESDENCSGDVCAVASVAVQELREVPTAESLKDLAKSLPISLDAVRRTVGVERDKWRASMEKELNSFAEQRVFDYVPRPKGHVPPARCVFTIKPTAENIPKRKTRIVLCGNFVAPYSAPTTSNLDSAALRIVLHVVIQRKWLLGTLDIPTAFLNANLGDERDVLCLPPKILEEMNLIPPNSCWKLRKALYGLREAPKLWEDARDKEMSAFEFGYDGMQLCLVPSVVHSSIWLIVTTEDRRILNEHRRLRPVSLKSLNVFEETDRLVDLQTVHPSVSIYGLVTVFVDDITIGANESLIRCVESEFDRVYKSGKALVLGIDAPEITHLGLQIASTQVERNSQGVLTSYRQVHVHQSRYIDEVIARHPELFSSVKNTPSPPDSFNDGDLDTPADDKNLIKRLQQVGGAILWLVVKTRPDLAWSYSRIASLQTRNPRMAWARLVHLCSYLNGTSDVGMVIDFASRGEHDLQLFGDISFCPNGDRSHCGVLAKLRGSVLTWRSFRQSITAMSTCEAELIASAEALETARMIQLLLSELWKDDFPSIAYVQLEGPVVQLASDNQAAIAQALKGNRSPYRTRHLSMRGHRVSEALEERTAVLTWVNTHEQTADYLTKPSPGPLRGAMLQALGLSRVTDF